MITIANSNDSVLFCAGPAVVICDLNKRARLGSSACLPIDDLQFAPDRQVWNSHRCKCLCLRLSRYREPKNPKGEIHEDWGIISFDRGRKQFLRQFHVEGFVNQFVTTSNDGRWTVCTDPMRFPAQMIIVSGTKRS